MRNLALWPSVFSTFGWRTAFLPVMMAKLGITQVQGVCHGDNLASRRVLEKCGFRRVYEGEALYHGATNPVYKAVFTLE